MLLGNNLLVYLQQESYVLLSLHGHPLSHLVKKSSGEWHSVGDYRNLNKITKPDPYPVPRLHSVIEKLKNKKVFSKIDLMNAYLQIHVHPDDIEKTGEGHFSAAVSAPPIRCWTTRRRTFRRRFLIYFYFSSYEEKTMKQAIS